jgi:serine/threonine-protein kinase
VFYSTRTGGGDLYQKLASGAAAEELIPISDQPEVPNSWTADGRFLLYHRADAQTGTDLWVLPMQGARTPSVFRQTPLREAWGAFSPDDKWVTYYSNESGRTEIYIRPFVQPIAGGARSEAVGGHWQVSTEGGVFPLWRPDGKELYYLGPSATMMAVPITATGATLEPGAPVALFRTRIYGGAVDLQLGRQYDVARDGRFLINTELDDAAVPITLLMNWRPEGKK